MVLLVLFAASGIVTAEPASMPECANEPPAEQQDTGLIPVPWSDDTYLFLPADPQDADKAGFWSESNLVDGLQTDPCEVDPSSHIYEADTLHGLAVP